MIKRYTKGVALLWSLIVIMVILIISGSLAGLIIKELRMSLNINFSEQAYAAARSGLEVARLHGCTDLAQESANPDPSDPLNIERDTVMLNAQDKVYYRYTISAQTTPGVCEIISYGYVGETGSRQISRKLKQKNTPKFIAGDIIGNSDFTNPTAHGATGVSYFKDNVSVVNSGNDPTKKFFARFDMNYISGGGPAAVGLAELSGANLNNVLGVAVANDGKLSRLTLNAGVVSLTNFATPPAAYSDYRFAFDYDGSSIIRISAYAIQSGSAYSCIGSTTYPSAGYHFNNLIAYGPTATNSPTGIIIKNSAGTTIGTLQNAVLTGMVAAPPPPPPPPPPVTYTLTINIDGYDPAWMTITGAGSYPAGATATVTIEYPTDTWLSYWSGDCIDTTYNSARAVMDSNKSCTAHFIPNE